MTTNWQKALHRRVTLRKCPEKYRHLVRAHGSSRARAVAYICSIGGYSDRHDRYPLAWSAKAYDADFGLKAMYESDARSEHSHLLDKCDNDGERGVLYTLFYETFVEHKAHLWEWATEEAWTSFTDDNNTFCGTEVYPTWSLLGRSSGNAVLDEFDGYRLRGSPEDLEQQLLERSDFDSLGVAAEYDVKHITVVDLFLYCVQIQCDWGSPKQVGAEVEYRASWRLWAMVDESELDRRLAEYRQQHPES